MSSLSFHLVLICNNSSSSFNVLKWMRLSEGLSWREILFITVGGLRGGLSLVLAQAVAAGQANTAITDQQRVRIVSGLG